jgi:DmsE family decaheme c-type cytochrome
VTCSNCHSIHGKALARDQQVRDDVPPEPGGNLLAMPSADPGGDFKPSHHPIIEGKVRCTDCHNPHGAITPAMLKQPTINDQCYSCHADKRGPYVFSHPPVEENCATCHNPHGSVHAKLLNESAPNLCQDCHDGSRHPGTIYGAAAAGPACRATRRSACTNKTGQPNADVNTRLIARACLNCHNAVHGSNAPRPAASSSRDRSGDRHVRKTSTA